MFDDTVNGYIPGHNIQIKLGGLNSRESFMAAIYNKVDYIDCVFDRESLNYITPIEAREMLSGLPLINIKKVAVVGHVTNFALNNIISTFNPDFIQFNSIEPPDKLKIIKTQFNCKIIKTIYVQSAYDLERPILYQDVADMFLFEPLNKEEFMDWSIFKKLSLNKPWILSGNISRYNFHYIIRATNAQIINLTSAIEAVPGAPDVTIIDNTVKAIRSYF